jgi:myosin heavy subunit
MKDRKNSIIDAMDQVINKKKSGKDGDDEFYQGLEKMWKDKKTKYGERKTPAGYRLDLTQQKGRKEYALGGPYGYDPAAKSAPRSLVGFGKQFETPGIFRLQHYAANVTYDVRNWIDRDMDKLSADSYECLVGSGLPHFMVSTFRPLSEGHTKTTVARDFANSLDMLTNTLGLTECNFVRCLKASNPLASDVFKNSLVLNQLKYTGMLDTLIIRRGGFPVRMEFQDFCDQYRVIAVTEADNAHTLAEALKGRTESILSRLEEKPPVNQQSDPIRVGTPKKASTVPLVLMRDWFARELDEEANIVKGKSAVIAQAATRMGFARFEYSRQIAARDIQSCLRGAQAHGPFASYRNCVLSCLPEARGLIARAFSAQAAECNQSASNKAATISFLQENIHLAQRESDERRQARTEDDYATLIAFARFGEKIVSLKAEAMREADSAHKQALERYAAVNEVVDGLAAKTAEVDARWTKMQEGGTVRSVPLVRQYKATAMPFNPPSKDAYKFRYSFTYKGSSE